MKKFKQYIVEVAKALSPSDKAAVAQFKVKKIDPVGYPEHQFKATDEKENKIDKAAPNPTKGAAEDETPNQVFEELEDLDESNLEAASHKSLFHGYSRAAAKCQKAIDDPYTSKADCKLHSANMVANMRKAAEHAHEFLKHHDAS